ncbi:MAG: hypothetical protein H6Q69_4866 [Firmicutes bacterium]|nr:hypothetical protein [Bacillota bacterium]
MDTHSVTFLPIGVTVSVERIRLTRYAVGYS